MLLAYTGGDTEANRVQLDAIRTAGTIVVGTGGTAALLLAARRQRTAEIALKQKDRDQADTARDHALQERVAAATEVDSKQRRMIDLYAKAADQLGHASFDQALIAYLPQDTTASRFPGLVVVAVVASPASVAAVRIWDV